jgi:hypothetical protein
VGAITATRAGFVGGETGLFAMGFGGALVVAADL